MRPSHQGRTIAAMATVVVLIIVSAAPSCLASAAAAAGQAGSGGSSSGGAAALADKAKALLQAHPYEGVAVALMLLYVLGVLAGRRENLLLAKEWSDAFAAPESSLFASQFSHHGYVGLDAKDASSFFWRDGPASFKFWGSGRRHCQGALFSVVTPPYHDLVRRLVPGLADSRLEVEVWMNDMAPMVMAAAPPKVLRALAKANEDVRDFAKRIDAPWERIPGWPGALGGSSGGSGSGSGGKPAGKELAVMAESAAVFGEVFGDARVAALIAREPAVAARLRSLVFTTEGSLGRPKSKLLFKFDLPGPGRMEELRPCMLLVFLLIDLVAAYKPSADAASKAAVLRARVKAAREDRRARSEGGAWGLGNAGGAAAERQQAAMARRAARVQEEREKARRQGPAALQKFEERMRKEQLKKEMKRRTVKMG